MDKKAKIDIIGISKGHEHEEIGPQELSAFGALGCFEENSALEIYRSTAEDKKDKKIEVVLRESAGRGHGSVADQNYFTFNIENLTRAATLQLCLPHYLAHLQQSLRRATADRGFYLPKEIRESELSEDAERILKKSFEVYSNLTEKGIPKEDARFLLPLYTKTNIQTSGNARELMNLYHMTKQNEVPSAVSGVVNEMIEKAGEIAPNLLKDWGYNYETLAWYPSSQMFASENKTIDEITQKYNYPNKAVYFEHEISEEAIDKAIQGRDEAELSNLKHIHNGNLMQGFLMPISIAGFHQSTRQRTWDHSIETIYSAAKRNVAVVPPSVEQSEYKQEYINQHNEMMQLYKDLIASGVSRKEAIGVVPHSLQMYDLIHVNGWNSIHSIGKRMCTEAQWEIRILANQVAALIKEKNPVLGKYTQPQGVVYGKCPERENCGLCEKILKSKR